MKKSLDYLPLAKKQDLEQLTSLIRERIQDCVMIILYGSYARNSYVDYDQRIEYGVPTYFMSDYDILIVTKKRLGVAENNLYSSINRIFFQNKEWRFHTHPQFINESIVELNKQIEQGRYFYSDIIKDGVILYDSGEYVLSQAQSLNYCQIRDLAQEYFDDKFGRANSFLYDVPSTLVRLDYRQSAFYLHQAAENFLRTIPMVFILYGYKDHDLEILLNYARTHTLDVCEVFPRDTEEEMRIFNLLKDSYVQARYNKNFTVTQYDIEILFEKVKRLRDITERVCTDQIAVFNQKCNNPS